MGRRFKVPLDLPALTTTQRGALTDVVDGELIYNSTNKLIEARANGSWVPLTSLVYNVKEFGAVGDGTADDTAAIQAAITASIVGSVVYLPTGNYKISSPLSMNKNNIGLVGDGYRATKITLANGSNSSMITTPDDGTQRYSLLLRDLSLDGNAANQTGSSPAINLRAMNEAKLEDLYILSPRGDAVRVGQATGGMFCTVPRFSGLVIRGDVTNSQGCGLALNSGSSDAQVTGCDIGFFSLAAGVSFSGHNGYLVESTNVWQCYYGYQTYQANRGRFVACLSDLSKRHGFICQESSILQFVACQARESSQATASTYDGFQFLGVGGTPATAIGLSNCWSVGAQARVGISYQGDLNGIVAENCYLNGNAVAAMVIGSNVTNHKFVNCVGVNPLSVVTTPTMPTTTTVVTNTTGVDVVVYIQNGTAAMTAISVGGVVTGIQIAASAIGIIPLAANQTIAFTYASGAPTWKWIGR